MGVLDHSSSSLTKIRYHCVSQIFLIIIFNRTSMENARFSKIESVLVGQMYMFKFQASAGIPIAKDMLASGGQGWW